MSKEGGFGVDEDANVSRLAGMILHQIMEFARKLRGTTGL